MDDQKAESLQNLCRDKMCLHLEREMIGHVLAKLADGADSVPVIGCDARTGVPQRMDLTRQNVDLTQSQLQDVPINPTV